MRPINVLVTACGCPGAATLIKMLRYYVDERKVRVIGVDCDNEAICRFLADDFYWVPPVSETEAYLDAVRDIVARCEIDIILPENDLEVLPLATRKDELEMLGCKVMVSSPESIILARDKYEMCRVLESAGVDLPMWTHTCCLAGFTDAVYTLGYPSRPICFKPPIGMGSRGFRIIDAQASRYDLLLNHKPNSKYITLDEAREVLAEGDWPELLVMEFVEGMEYTADCLCMDGRALLTTVKSNEQVRWGVTVRGELVDRPDLVKQVERILQAIPLSYCVNLQFIGGKLIEINPRVSTFIYQDDLIMPYLAIKLALGELTEEQVRERQDKVKFGRRFVRYMDQVFFES